MQKNIMLFVMFLLSVSMFSQEDLQEVKITKKQKGIKKSYTLTANTSVITSKELLKAACCNLAESFETNPSIDVNFSDALTGTKQIKMLGLTSPYLLISEENLPSVRGASQAYGLSFTPGTWIESVQITKGAGSVINGYESISGQINTELLKPLNDIPFFLNAYGSTDARFELNTHFNKKLSDKWATSLFVHGNARVAKNDMNDDGFLDNPLGKQINVLNRYQYYNPDSGLVSFINFRYMNDKKQTGEVDFDKDTDRGTKNHWGSEINTERFDVSTKIGYVFKDMPYQSIGFQNAFNTHNQNSYFGLSLYDIRQNSFYSNLIFNSIINNTKHKFSTGLNFAYDQYQEFVNANDYSRIDNSVGAFFEYTYDNTDNFSLILGGRVDNHNRLGVFVTPRLHMRYNPWKFGVLRVSAGRGKRSANIFSENQQLFASSRAFSILDQGGKIYGLNPEIAWNYGVSFSQKFRVFNKNAEVGFDFYRTDFQNQAVVDLMQSPQDVLFYNLKGSSFANSFQLEFNFEFIHNLNLRTAYKYYDIQTDYLRGTFQRPLQAKHRFLGNLEYETKLNNDKQWKFDYTFNWSGKQQLPYTASNPTADQFPDFSPSYAVMNVQVTRIFSPVFEVYVGGENIGNYKQDKAILGASDPFGPNFDASVAYAPIFGQMYYAGLRFKIK
ncbi:TonB-dependent receptor plug domain-containing protein [Flavobacterium collinsii]|uniref:Vitamin B12 transporter BtuB n=1 Tax=Flavobacterium collinsii TaxID=1114861 RepID=A0ABM8KJM8_9FLAO|nr:TonB-dependent receptor plug domain-containing protein [Flavobacterium collinsii]CAA9199252.1 Vitamin B12 transporter BtuB [Flavobacterium collinsii]